MTSRVHGGVQLSAICADDLGAHVFRHQVADRLRAHWRNRAAALETCGEAGARVRCGCCAAVHVMPFRCGARCCPTCAHIASAVAVEKLAARSGAALAGDALERAWEGPGFPKVKRWLLFTGTQQTAGHYGDPARYEHRELVAAIQRVRQGWGAFWRATPWGARVYERSPRTGILGTRTRRDVIFSMGVEVAPGGMVHCHAAIYGEHHWTERAKVRAAWEGAIGRKGQTTIGPMKAGDAEAFRKSLREVLKYVSKGEKGARRVEHAAAIERAMRGVRRVEMGGAIRARGWQATPLDLVSHKQECADCGASAQWEWAGLRAPSYVMENGGFGIDSRARLKRDAKPTDFSDGAIRDRIRARHEGDGEWGAPLEHE